MLATESRDVFVCHGGEDKEEIVRPMVGAFQQASISCWHDEAEIRWGDSITQKVNEGLGMSRYVIVVFSSAFAEKNWPQREMNAALNAEASTGEVRVLPLLVGSEQDKERILAQFPLLNDKRYLPWDGNLRTIVREMLKRLGREAEPASGRGKAHPAEPVGLRIPLPKVRKRFSQRDKDLFLREAFATVAQYFRTALTELKAHYEGIETDFVEVHSFKFICTIYVRGEAANRCKIWIGGLTSSDSIAYQCGQFNMNNDSSFNDILTVTDDRQSLGFEPSHMWLGGGYTEKSILSAEEMAEYLWRRFTETLG